MTPEQNSYLISAEKGDRFDLSKDELTIGRSAGNDLHFAFPEVSSKHATLKRTESGWTITDHGSTNGTFINGKKLTGEGYEFVSGISSFMLSSRSLSPLRSGSQASCWFFHTW